MAFPATVLGTQLELQLNGAWTQAVRYDTNTKILDKSGISISRGAGGLQDKTPPGTCTWIWQDPNGIYNNENPRSPYYNLLARNTPVRVYVPRAQNSLYTRYGATGTGNGDGLRCSCPDTAGISITGDLDVRIEVEPKRWNRWGTRDQSLGSFHILASKIGASPQRAWVWYINEQGMQRITTSSDGSSSRGYSSAVAIDVTKPRIALRFTLDVDNGAGGSLASFYYSDSIGGTWTLLDTFLQPSTTAIFDNTSPLEVGSMGGGVPLVVAPTPFYNWNGRIYSFELRNGIAGSLVAKADFTAQTKGATSFADGLGNTWTIGPAAEITNADYRFHGELSAPKLTPNRSKNGLGLDVQVSGEAGGILRRLQANDTPLFSPLRRLLSSATYNGPSATSTNAYWPGEDASASDTTSASSALTGVNPAIISDITFNGPDLTLPGSAGVMVCGSTAPTFFGTCKPATQTTELHFVGLFKFPTTPTGKVIIFQIFTKDSPVVQWTWESDATGYGCRGYNAAGTEVVTKTTAWGAGAEPTRWIAFHLQLTNSAGTVNIKPEWMALDSGVLYTQSGIGTVSFAGTPGTVASVAVAPNITLGGSGLRFGQIITSTLVGLIFWDGANPTFYKVASGYRGETADARFIRLCGLLGVTPVIFGQLGGTEQMGAEPLDTGINILYECQAVDGGVIVEAPDQPNALEYYTRKSLALQLGTLSMTWAQLAKGLEATPDDTDIANDITLTRRNGGSAVARLDFGPMSTQAPPNGINDVPDGPTINNYQDARLTYLVQQMLQIRSWPTARYPTVTVNLEHPTFSGNANLFLQAQRQIQPMLMTITTLPNFMPPDDLALLVKGIKETLYGQQWKIEWACVPYGPYVSSELWPVGPGYAQYKATHTTLNGVVQSQLNAAITIGATSFAVKMLTGALFDTAAVNIPVKIGGELMTVGSVSGTTSPQTFNSVIRGVNGFSSAHNANDAVVIYPALKARL
jgi:hypothetical protein